MGQGGQAHVAGGRATNKQVEHGSGPPIHRPSHLCLPPLTFPSIKERGKKKLAFLLCSVPGEVTADDGDGVGAGEGTKTDACVVFQAGNGMVFARPLLRPAGTGSEAIGSGQLSSHPPACPPCACAYAHNLRILHK